MNQLRTTRKDMGLTQIEAANICGVSRRTYQTYEKQINNDKKISELVNALKTKGVLSQSFIRNKASDIFKKYPEVKCAYLYGSYARKEANVDSDIDILVVCHGMGLNFFKMENELKDVFNKEIDLQTSEQILDNQKIIENILVEGIRLYKKK